MSATRQLTPDEIANTSPCAACHGLGYLRATPDTSHEGQWHDPVTELGRGGSVTCTRCYGDGVQR
jgi:hypothetical protein